MERIGKLVIELTAIGSKSESKMAFLLDQEGNKIKVKMKNANPFMDNPLLDYENKEVILEGEMNENDTFIVEVVSVKEENLESEVKDRTEEDSQDETESHSENQ